MRTVLFWYAILILKICTVFCSVRIKFKNKTKHSSGFNLLCVFIIFCLLKAGSHSFQIFHESVIVSHYCTRVGLKHQTLSCLFTQGPLSLASSNWPLRQQAVVTNLPFFTSDHKEHQSILGKTSGNICQISCRIWLTERYHYQLCSVWVKGRRRKKINQRNRD